MYVCRCTLDNKKDKRIMKNFKFSNNEENVKEVDKLNLDIKAGEDLYKLELS